MASESLQRDLVRDALSPSPASAPSRADFFLHDSGYSFEGAVIFLDVDGVLHPLGGSTTFVASCMAELAARPHVHASCGYRFIVDLEGVRLNARVREWAAGGRQGASVRLKTVSLLSIDDAKHEIAQWLDNHPKVAIRGHRRHGLLDGNERADHFKARPIRQIGLTAPLADLAIRIAAA